MSENGTPTPRVYISYSHTSQEHKIHIRHLGERLRNDGVDVKLDQWDLKTGQDKLDFMEQMVKDPMVSKVLVCSDKAYAEKADKRRSGVGTETQIISKKIYEKVDQNKFIPIVFEFDSSCTPPTAYLPVFLQNRIYIDFSTRVKMSDNYDILLREIFGRPLHPKPELGKPPAYIFEETTPFASNRTALEQFERALTEDRSNFVPLARMYLDAFHAALEKFRITPEADKMEQAFFASVHHMIAARDEVVAFYDLAFRFKDDEDLFETVLDFLEKCLSYNLPPSDMTSYDRCWFENFAFFNHECFVYLTATLIERKRDHLLNALMSREYYVDAQRAGSSKLYPYTVFCSRPSRILDQRNKRDNLRRLSPEADLFKQRASIPGVPLDDFMQADFVLWLRSIVNDVRGYCWYPYSIIYTEFYKSFPLFARAASKEGFRRVAEMLSVSSGSDLKRRFDEAMSGPKGQGWTKLTFDGDVCFKSLMNYDALTAERTST